MRAITHKTVRDLRRQRAQIVAVAVTIMLGVALYVASAGAFANLSGSYATTYHRLRFADLTATGGEPDRVAAAARAAGAGAATTRTVLDPPMLVAGTRLVGRVIGLPTGTSPAIDAVDVRTGSRLSTADPDGVLVEQHTADTFGLHPGDRVRVFAGSGWHTATVRGIAVSAEYLWPARSRQDVLDDPHGFAVLFAAEPTVAHWSGMAPNQTLVVLPAAAATGIADRVVAAMRHAGAVDVTTRAEQPSNAALGQDLAGFNELSVVFPLLFLTAAAVAAYVLLTRRVLAERSIIGMLMAAGARRGRLVRHYLLQGLLIGLFGAIAGVATGVPVTGLLTRAYTRALGIPDTVVTAHPGLVVTGVVFGIVVGLVGAAAPAITAARTVPAVAMRNMVVARPPGGWSRFVARLAGLPVAVRMALRDVARSRRRTFATMVGTVLALVLALASTGMMTSVSAALAVSFGQIDREDATVTTQTGAASDTAALLRTVPGVAAVEAIRTGPVIIRHAGRTYATTMTGFPSDTTMHGFRSAAGGWLPPPTTGVYAGAALAGQLGVTVGDTITLATTRGTVDVRLAGLLDEPMGTAVYGDTTIAARVLADTGTATYLVRFAGGAGRDALRRRITQLPGVLAYADSRAITASINQYLGLLWAFIVIMIVLGGVLAFTVIYVTMTVNVVERTNELATLRTAGVPLRRVAGSLATESLAATAIGVPVGLVLGVLATRALLNSFSTDLFHFDLTLPWWALLAAAAGVLLAAGVSQWPAARAVRRMDIARVVRERAT